MRYLNTFLWSTVTVAALCFGSANAADTPFTFTTLAGNTTAPVKSADGTGSDAQFWAPRGIAIDSEGTLYVADSNNNTIRKITTAKVVTTFSGVAGTNGGPTDKPAKYHEPYNLAVDSSGTIYVADTNNGAIRKITKSGAVSLFAGGNGRGHADGAAATSKFDEPRGIAVHTSTGNIYVADYENNVVRKITSDGIVSTLAGTVNTPGTTDGQGTAARFSLINGIAVDNDENIYVADAGAKAIRKITKTGLVSTFAGGEKSTTFSEPRGVAVDATGNVYVADYGGHAIYKLTPTGVATKLAGTKAKSGSTDGTAEALFNGPSGITLDSANNLYVADTTNNTIRKINSAGLVETFAGLAGRSSSADGKGTSAQFEEPYAVATDGAFVYVSDPSAHIIRKISADGTVTTLAGKAGSYGSTDGQGTAALFYGPRGIAASGDGTVYVADSLNAVIRKISPSGAVTTLAGTAGVTGTSDGTGSAAKFDLPYGIAVDASGNVFVGDFIGCTVRKITAAGVVTTLAGTARSNGFTNGTGTAARFNIVGEVAVDSAGNVYAIDRNNHAIRKITPAGVVTTLAGSGSPGNTDGNGSSAKFQFPSGLAVDSTGNVYVADTDNQQIRKVTPNGDVTTIAGGKFGYADDVGTLAKFKNPKDVAMDPSGNLYVADMGNYVIRKGSVATTAVSSSDCLFNWAEQHYSSLLSPAGASATLSDYYYRYYSGTKSYLATKSSDNHLYFMGPATGNTVTDLGAVSTWLTQAGCQ